MRILAPKEGLVETMVERAVWLFTDSNDVVAFEENHSLFIVLFLRCSYAKTEPLFRVAWISAGVNEDLATSPRHGNF